MQRDGDGRTPVIGEQAATGVILAQDCGAILCGTSKTPTFAEPRHPHLLDRAGRVRHEVEVARAAHNACLVW